MGITSSKDNSETINWNNIKTENISSSAPNFSGLSKDAKRLIASLNIPSITESETSEMNLNSILDKINSGLGSDDQQKFNKLLEQVSSTASEDLSNTSPFISSEMYEYLVNSKTSETDQAIQAKQTVQAGGAKKSAKSSKPVKSSKSSKSSKSKKSKGGALSDDSSDTSSTSSDSSLEDLIDSTEAEILDARDKKNKNKNKNNNKDKKHKKDDSDSELSGGELSYLSSSAHTEGAFSDSSNVNKRAQSSSRASESVQSSSQTETSVANENHGMLNTSASVNTEDINMVSDY